MLVLNVVRCNLSNTWTCAPLLMLIVMSDAETSSVPGESTGVLDTCSGTAALKKGSWMYNLSTLT